MHSANVWCFKIGYERENKYARAIALSWKKITIFLESYLTLRCEIHINSVELLRYQISRGNKYHLELIYIEFRLIARTKLKYLTILDKPILWQFYILNSLFVETVPILIMICGHTFTQCQCLRMRIFKRLPSSKNVLDWHEFKKKWVENDWNEVSGAFSIKINK